MESIFDLKDAAKIMGGVLNAPDEGVKIQSVSRDTRDTQPGALFFALKGENTDGHKFIREAMKKGAVCCVVERVEEGDKDIPTIKVKNTGQALLDFAGEYRKRLNIPIVAITGSVGKTSTKGMVGCVMSEKYNAFVTGNNYNNEIGVPLTVCEISGKNEIAVIEAGMNHFGELSRITKALLPNTVIITNIGEAHIQNLGSREGILKAKLEMLEGLSQDGTVILNGDDEYLWNIRGTLDFETLYYGITNDKCDIVGTNVRTYPDGSEFKFEIDGKEHAVKVSIPGRHHIYNSLASIIAGLKYNVPINDIKIGISRFEPTGLRQAEAQIGKCLVIKDCYNANLYSMNSGLEVLALSNKGKRKVACLGDMLELGTISEESHMSVGKLVVKYNIDCLITVGEAAKFIAKGAHDAGMSKENIHIFNNNEEVKKELYNILEDEDVLLLKASRGMKLEEIADYMEEVNKSAE